MIKYKLIKKYPNSLKLGTIATIDDCGQYVTDDLNILYLDDIENFPEFWEKQEDWDELLKEAKKRYPIGTRYISPISKTTYIVKNPNYEWNSNYHDEKNSGIQQSALSGWLYYKGKWAEIIEPLFKTKDEINIYEGDSFYYTSLKNRNISKKICNALGGVFAIDCVREGNMIFSTKEAAEEWIEKNKSKPKEYENYSFNKVVSFFKYHNPDKKVNMFIKEFKDFMNDEA